MSEMNKIITEIVEDSEQLEEYPKLFFKLKVGYLQAALKFSDSNIPEEEGYIRTLRNCLESLNRIANNSGDAAVLYEDFVKHSFYFVLYDEKTGAKDFNGGIILHGYQETLAVELNPSNKPHYSIHT